MLPQQPAFNRRQRGFSLLELVVVIILIGSLLALALSRLAGYVEAAERVAVLNVEGQLRNALLLTTAQRVLRHDDDGVAALDRSNPMRLVLETPYNYAGELNAAAAEQVAGRHWFFDRDRRQLVYRRGGRLTGTVQQDLRYAVRIAYDDRDGDGIFAAARDDLVGVRLQRVN